LERVPFALAGSMTLVSVLLGTLVNPWFLLLAALVGGNRSLYVVTRARPASVVLERAGVERRRLR
jgi:hypothetical protein